MPINFSELQTLAQFKPATVAPTSSFAAKLGFSANVANVSVSYNYNMGSAFGTISGSAITSPWAADRLQLDLSETIATMALEQLTSLEVLASQQALAWDAQFNPLHTTATVVKLGEFKYGFETVPAPQPSAATLASTMPLSFTGSALADTLTGNAGHNTLNGFAGADTMIGLGGNDTYLVDDAADRVVEAKGGGIDKVIASVSYTLRPGQEIERLEAAASPQPLALTGNEFANTLVGNSGSNVLNGRGGADVLIGGFGNDRFVFSAVAEMGTGAGRDVISDFEQHGDNDTIDLSGLPGTLSFIGSGAFTAAGQVRVLHYDDGYLVQINTAGNDGAEAEIFLKGVGPGQLSVDDFIL